MKALVLLILCFTSIAFAEDFKTIDGKEYKNVTVSRVEPDGIVLVTRSGIAKVYFVELAKDTQKRFGYHAAEIETERAPAIEKQRAAERERAEKERNAAEKFEKSEVQFKAAENQAAQNYKSGEKGTLSGQVFVATQGRENVKLGAVRVSLFARDAIDVLLTGLKAFADAKIEQVRKRLAAAKTAMEQAEAEEQQAEAARQQAEVAWQQADAYKNEVSRNDARDFPRWEKQAADAAKRNLNTARQAAESARKTADTARERYSYILPEESIYYSGAFYFKYLRSPIQTAETDGEGRFTIQVPRTGAFVIAVQTERMVWDNTEIYYWLQPVSLEGRQQGVQNLSNNNLTETTGTSSLIRTLGNFRGGPEQQSSD